MSALRRTLDRAVTLLAGVAALGVLAGAVLMWSGFRVAPVLSGSMAPEMPQGSLAVVRTVSASSVQVGDVVTFRNPLAPTKRITHRVVAISADGGERRYTTRGDANAKNDPWQLRLPGDVGRREATIPHLGTVAGALAGPAVMAASIVLTTLFVLIAVLLRVWRRPADPGAASARRASTSAYGTPW